jgi:hypothetical protein
VQTRWELKLDAKGAARARAMARDVRDLDTALRSLGQSSGALSRVSSDTAALRSVRSRVRAERVVGAAVVREQRRARDARIDGAATQQRIARAVDAAQRASLRRQESTRARRERSEAQGALRVARLNARAFQRSNEYQLRTAQQADRARARAAQRESRGGLGLAGVGATLGVIGAISMATLGALSAVTDMATAVGGLVFGISSATLQMIAFREASLTTLRAMARDPSGRRLTGAAADREARGQFRFAQEFARQTPLDTAQVLDLQRQTSAAGFSGARNREVVQAAADVGAFNPNDPSSAGRFLLGLGQLRNASTVRLQDLRQTSQAAGLGENDILREIARGAGMTQRAGETDTAYNARIQRAQQGGRFTGAQGVEGVLAALRARNGGDLGTFARSQGGTLTGTLSNLRGAILDFVTSVDDIENLPGILSLKKTLNSVVSVLTGGGLVAARLRLTFAGIVNEAAQFASTFGGKRGVEGLVSDALDAFEQIAPIAREITAAFGSGVWEGLSSSLGPLFAQMRTGSRDMRPLVGMAGVFGTNLGRLAGFGMKLTGALVLLLPLLTEMAADLAMVGDELARTDRYEEVGRNIVDGIRRGFMSPSEQFLYDVGSWGRDIADAARGALDIQSPSRVFAEIGEQIPAGMALGIDRGAPQVDASVRALGAPQGGTSGPLGARVGDRNITLNAVFNINVGDLAGGLGDVGQTIGQSAWQALVGQVEASLAGV